MSAISNEFLEEMKEKEVEELNKGQQYIDDACQKVYGGNNFPSEAQQQIALLVQLNLNLQRLSDLMFIATGLEDVDIPDTVADTYNDNSETLSLKDNSLMCPFCHQPTIVDARGYCLKCRRDVAGHLSKRKM